ncbi:keratin, type II cytoskeletal cochleal [Trichomycterus rosablanca]|uniref:keratin, type II cytoskeletal cochleal n=1 Tax=Trichomycterus rosablanca TaxID=2290929 RepID=UPI002F35B669
MSGASYRRNFSSRSLGSYPPAGRTIPRLGSSYFGFGEVPAPGRSIGAVMVDMSLLASLQLELDPRIHEVKLQEKEQIKSLNNRFASFIDKVRHLEQENKMLETKWQLLQSDSQSTSDLGSMLESYISKLQSKLHNLHTSEEKLKSELHHVHSLVDNVKQRYEDEIDRRISAENDFVILKKDVDTVYMVRTALQDKLEGLLEDQDFFKTFYERELRELATELERVSVVVEMDNSRQLNLDQIVQEVKSRYEEVSARSRQEAAAWFEKKFELVSSQAEQRGSELRNAKREISDLKRVITRLQTDVADAKAQCERVGDQISEAEHGGEAAVQTATRRLRDLEGALQRAKQQMAEQVRQYQEVMSTKLALDMEIATYRTLLEGEESRIGQHSVKSVQLLPNTSYAAPATPIVISKF